MRKITEKGEQFLRRVDGLFVGQLDADEMQAFEKLREAGYARRSYEGEAGLFGLAKVRRVRQPEPLADQVLDD